MEEARKEKEGRRDERKKDARKGRIKDETETIGRKEKKSRKDEDEYDGRRGFDLGGLSLDLQT